MRRLHIGHSEYGDPAVPGTAGMVAVGESFVPTSAFGEAERSDPSVLLVA
ncbi:hypothetical protein FHX42_001775 [Saccharopolyspora lacisalsi]|uniref:Uncharacterized protein n=1 Tax=Halosaccharopolyspora lacisalsi TaxID=1000566 RepID=A0A839E0C7_9PSEU|nr:hypothetical protein [Halosaccharopolyspora lacisalsi]MBA8824428.1 hypothetical protein [Halosaccharopolyspora lacisalsi]